MVSIFKKRKTLLVILLVFLAAGAALYLSHRKAVAEKNYIRGEELSRQRNYLEANMAFLKALEINPDSQRAPYARFLLASNYVAMTAYSQAITEYRKLIEEFPGHEKAADAQFMIGMVYKNAIGDNEKALEAFEKYRQNYPRGKSSGEVQNYLKRMRR
ncbi:MAG: tetratricopeptide repeat protein [Elusimicrobiota bacterium]|nr:tetratricopeptide repeat protein [Elusimicrobiota bacterium]